VCVNASGWAARRLGLPDPVLTIMAGAKLAHPDRGHDRQAMRGLRTERMLLITYALDMSIGDAERVMEALGLTYGQLDTIDFETRALIIEAMVGPGTGRGHKDRTRVSNGIFAACLALHLQASEVVLAGFSLTSDGHSYGSDTRRRHVVPDREAMVAMRRQGLPLRTSEPALAELTGLPLV
jgi:hypothetical protein